MRTIVTCLFVGLFGVAAPVRAWCEAACAQPARADVASAHCPDHARVPAGTALTSAGSAIRCLTPDAAGLASQPKAGAPDVRLAADLTGLMAPPARGTLAPRRAPHASRPTLSERATPLRL